MDPAFSALVVTASRLLTVRYVKVATAMLLLAEGVETFPMEVKYIWRSKWTAPKLLYILTRYTVYFDIALSLTHWLAPNLSLSECKMVYDVKTGFTYAGIGLSELVLILRTHAIFMRSKKVLYFLGSLWILGASGNAAVLHYFLRSVDFTAPPIPSIPGCNINHQSPILFICFASFLLFEILIVVMTMKKAIQFVRSAPAAQSQLLAVLYRDGIIYFIVLMLASLANCILLTTAPKEYGDLLTTVTRVLHAILCCRILINLRQARDKEEDKTDAVDMTSTTKPLRYTQGIASAPSTNEMQEVELEPRLEGSWVRAHAPGTV